MALEPQTLLLLYVLGVSGDSAAVRARLATLDSMAPGYWTTRAYAMLGLALRGRAGCAGARDRRRGNQVDFVLGDQ